MNKRRIKDYINALAERHEMSRYPVDLKKWVAIAGANVRSDNFDDDLSGFAYQKNGIKIIGVNSNHPPERKRFTIGHELGHMFLHKQTAVNYDEASIMLRTNHAANKTDIKEIEANNFAAELLMPEEYIRKDVRKRGKIDLEDMLTIEALAEKYKVSTQAMTVRLTHLYYS